MPDIDCLGLLRGCIAATLCADLGVQIAHETVSRFARALDNVTLEALAACPGSAVLLAALALSRRSDSLPASLERYIEVARTESTLDGLPESIALLIGQLDGVTATTGQPTLDLEAERLLGAPKDIVRDAYAKIESATSFGTRRGIEEPKLSEILDAIVVERLGRYDFEFAASVMRARFYLNACENLASSTFRTYVVNQRDSDGSIGIFHREADLLRQASPAANPDVQISLPTTLAVLWALAEMDDAGYRLYRDIGTR